MHSHSHHDHRHDPAHAPHGHVGHDHAADGGRSRSALLFALVITSIFAAVEAIGGWYAHSLALLADAGHMVTDVLSLALAFMALHAGERLADAQRTYGYRRYQVLAAFVNGLLLLLISAGILFEAAMRAVQPEPVAAVPMMVIASAGLFVNVLVYLTLHRAEENLNTQAAIAHVFGDLLGSVAALVAGAIIWFSGWTLADPLLSALVALWLLRSGLSLTRSSGHVLLEGSPEHLDLSDLESQVREAVPAVIGIHHVHAWSLTPEQPVMTLHAVVREDFGGDEAIAGIAAFLKKRHGVTHVTVQVERGGCGAHCA